MHPGLLLLLLGLCTWRATRLVTRDSFPPIRWARDRVEQHGPEWLADLVTCHFCASVWLAAGITAATDLFVSVPRPLLMFGSAAAIGALIADHENRKDEG